MCQLGSQNVITQLNLFLSLLLTSSVLYLFFALALWPSSSVSSIWSVSSPFLKYESDELEKSVYQDYDSDSDVPEELKQDYVDEQTGDAPLKRSVLYSMEVLKACEVMRHAIL